MKKSKIILFVICIFIILLLAGCSNKTAITNEQFINASKHHNFIVTDVLDQYSSYGYFESATVAQSNEGWQVEFYVLEDDAYATSMFNTNKSLFESYKGNFSSESSYNMNNHSTYSLTSSGYYMYICRINNTLVYAKVQDIYKDSVQQFIERLGY